MSYSWGDDSSTDWDGGFDYGSVNTSYKEYDKGRSYVANTGPLHDMDKAYKLSTRVMNTALTKGEKELLNTLEKNNIIVIPGTYDSVEKVLDASGTPYTLADHTVELNPSQIVLVNCPGRNLSVRYNEKRDTDALAKFVSDGGFLVTTDWALEDVIMESFPEYLNHSGTDTDDDVVEVDLVASGSPYTKGLGNGALKPVWWLEGASYPIGLGNKEGIDVLLGSEEMRQKYGEMPIAVKFNINDGRVIHVTSHFYLQTCRSKYDAQAQKTGEDFAANFLGFGNADISNIGNLNTISFGALESAYTSVRFLHNIFLQKIKANRNLKKKEFEAFNSLQQQGLNRGVSLRKSYSGKKSKKLL